MEKKKKLVFRLSLGVYSSSVWCLVSTRMLCNVHSVTVFNGVEYNNFFIFLLSIMGSYSSINLKSRGKSAPTCSFDKDALFTSPHRYSV